MCLRERTLKSQLDSTENALMNARMLHERAQSQLLSLQAKQAAQAEVGRSEADLLLAELTSAILICDLWLIIMQRRRSVLQPLRLNEILFYSSGKRNHHQLQCISCLFYSL